MAEAGQVNEVIHCKTVDLWKEHFDKGKDSKKLVVVDFTAAWCGPCRFISPILVELAKKTPQAIFLKVDVNELKTVAAEFEVEAMPTFLFLKEGKVVDKIVGADKAGLENKVQALSALADA